VDLKFAKVGAVRIVFVAAWVLSCWAASTDDQQFNGRWDIAVSGASTPRAWWLEISGAGTGNLKGKFVGASVGLVDEIPKLSVSDGELRFALDGHFRRDRGLEKALYWARFEDSKLKGTFEIEGDPSSYLEWSGVRAPVLPEKDDGSWKKADPLVLLDGHDLAGWQPLSSVRPPGWTIKDGLLTGLNGASNLISEKKFWNFSLDAEYRIGNHADARIGLRGRYEVQITDDIDRSPSNRGSGAILGRIAPTANVARLAGEWQTLTVRLVGRQVTVVLNGVRVIDRQIIDGPTGIMLDANEGDPGPILLECERGPLEFRKIVVHPLAKRP
jgi:hypothetical protein